MRTAKWVIGITAGLLALAVAALLVVTLLVDPNRFKGQIESRVTKLTGRPFEIRGDIDLAWFPSLALETGAASLGNTPGFGGAPLVEWESLAVGVRVLPFIRGHLIVDGIRMHGLRIHLQRLADGRASWEPLLVTSGEASDSSAARGDGGKQASRAEERSSPAELPTLGGIEVRAGTIIYDDAQTGATAEVSDWNLDIDGWRPDEETAIVTRGVVALTPAVGARAWNVTVDFTSHIRMAGDFTRVMARATKLDARAQGGFLANAEVPVAFQAPEITAQLASSSDGSATAAMPVFTLGVAGLDVRGSVTAARTGGTTEARGALELSGQSLRDSLAALGIDAPLPRDQTLVRLVEASAPWTYQNGALAIRPLALRLDETRFSGEIVRAGGDQGILEFNLHADRMDVGRYAAVEDTSSEPFELPGAALKALRARGELRLDEAKLADAQVRGITLRLETDDAKAPASEARGVAARE